MSDFRNYDYRNPNDPFGNGSGLDPNVRAPSATWGWIAAAVFLVVVLAVAFGAGHKPASLGTNTASNDKAPSAIHMAPPTAHMAPPATISPPPTANPAPGTPTPPASSAPSAPAQQSAH